MLLKQVIEDLPPRPRKLDSHVPRDLETICLKCLAKQPSHRYNSARELADELRRFLNREPILARPVGPVARIWQWYYGNPTATAMTAGGYATSVASILIAWAILGILLCALGFTPGSWQLVFQLIALLLACYVPVLFVGIWTLRGYVRPLWIGTILAVFGCAASIIGLGNWAFDAEVFGSRDVRIPLFSLLLILASIGLLTHVIALVSHFSKRNGD